MQEIYDKAKEEISGKGPYAGLGIGTFLEGYDRFLNSGGSVFGQHLNSWGGDHLVHAGYGWGLATVSDLALEKYHEMSEEARKPSNMQKVVAAASVITAFTLAKEGYIDAAPDYMDVAANYAPMAKYHPSVGMDSLEQFYRELRGEDVEPAELD